MPLPAPLRRPAPIYPRRSKKSGGVVSRAEGGNRIWRKNSSARARTEIEKDAPQSAGNWPDFLSKNGLNKEKNQVA